MLIISRDISDINAMKRMLESKFDMKDLRVADVILGIRIHRTPQGLALSQYHHIKNVLDKFKYMKFDIAKTPLDVSFALRKNEGKSDLQLEYAKIKPVKKQNDSGISWKIFLIGSNQWHQKMATESQIMDKTTSVGATNIAISSLTNASPTMAPAEKSKKFSGIDFKRWQQKIFFYLTTLCLQRFTSEDAPEELYSEWSPRQPLQCLSGTKTSKELWGALEQKFKTEDAGIKKFLVARFLDFKIIDSKSVVSQVQELQVITHDLLAEVKSGEVKYSHFIFKLDFADWELMKKAVPEGEELMPNRDITTGPVFTEANIPNSDISANPVLNEAYKLVPVDDSQLRLRVTRVKKLSRKHGKVLREVSDVDNSPETGSPKFAMGA
ncbi:hypothetical protein T459_30656 [Capsicum annuum]|uniref:Reverse transcriptase Ty1/copia-type domain-containing protein n=1 Tax=Capsicum annuum TaxID=4072 RepID=A0A2G2Y9K1_CAPAN|nr:putative non-structural maintenance of chromosomes element 4 -like protein A-like [Capsicum annuum]PHT66231.1 hypothetical protein T459_30656 [Capsicum annuum]